MSLLPHLAPVSEYLRQVRELVPFRISLSTTQKVVLVSVGASIVVVGGLARYLRRKKRTIDPAKLKRNNISGKRSRASGVRSPNDIGSIASSGRRSGAYSNVYGERYGRQGSTIASASEKASVVSGSLASGSITIAAADGGGDGDGVLTPQQLGVMDPRERRDAADACKSVAMQLNSMLPLKETVKYADVIDVLDLSNEIV